MGFDKGAQPLAQLTRAMFGQRVGATWATVAVMLILHAAPTTGGLEDGRIIKELFTSDYDPGDGPTYLDGGPCDVDIDIYLVNLGPIDALSMEFTTSFYLRQQWVDPRLQYNNTLLGGNQTSISLSARQLDKMWLPDLFFSNGRSSRFHDVTMPNVYITISPDGSVLYSTRITSTLNCVMDLRLFPHDTQECRISMESYGLTTKELTFKWHSTTTENIDLPLNEFNLIDYQTNDCTTVYATGTFTCLEALLVIKREMGSYFIGAYIPSMLTVSLSWVAFWLDHTAVPARISVGLLTVLTISTQSSGARASLPKVSYVKAIDVWMSANLLFVFFAYMEFAVVTVVSRKFITQQEEEDAKENDDSNEEQDESNMATYIPPFKRTHEKKQSAKPKRNGGSRVDWHSRWLFPVAYVGFVTIYWLSYS